MNYVVKKSDNMKEFLSQFNEIDYASIIAFVDEANHAIQYFKLNREQFISIYDILIKEG